MHTQIHERNAKKRKNKLVHAFPYNEPADQRGRNGMWEEENEWKEFRERERESTSKCGYAIFIGDTIKIKLDSTEQGVYKWNLFYLHHFLP